MESREWSDRVVLESKVVEKRDPELDSVGGAAMEVHREPRRGFPRTLPLNRGSRSLEQERVVL